MVWNKEEAALHKKLGAIERKDIIKNDQVQKFLTSTVSARYKEFEWGGMVIKLIPTLTKALKTDIDALHDFSLKATTDELGIVTDGVYTMVAALCVEEPWNDPKTWEAIDAEQSVVWQIFSDILGMVNSPFAGLQSFPKD